ncbi:S1 family peptidase, partial [Pseudonocardia pini]|uniref:S1 family peptidase n=1 Tax=Pseudonocardia pini TaxID=2758030 RepID=UPI0015F10782
MSTRSRLLTVSGALVATAAATALVAPVANADEQGTAVNDAAEKSLVQVDVDFAGLIGRPTLLGGFRWSSSPTILSQSCSGFFVTGSGHIATAGHCVDPEEARDALITQYVDDQVTAGSLTPSEAADLLPEALATWDVQGPTPGSEVQRRIEVGQPRDVDGAALEVPQPARLLDFDGVDSGDLALLKVERRGTPALPIGDTDPESGATVTAVGFPGAVSQVVDPDLARASFKSGTVSSHQVSRGGVAQTEINADLAPGMSGGPTFDASGVVVGVNSFVLEGEQAFNFITDTTDLRDWLATQGLTTPSEAPAGADPAGLLVDGGPVQNAA